jgi:hypothetical protein
VKVEYPGEHRAVGFVDRPMRTRLHYEKPQLVCRMDLHFRDRRDAEQPQKMIGRAVEQPDHR